jgi:NTE family protein
MEQLSSAVVGSLAAKRRPAAARPPFECIALLLQGGGALGSYQAGVYAALAEAELHPDWVAGISIGAINGALIAGNAPERRVEQLRKFWEQITASTHGLDAGLAPLSEASDIMRGLINQTSAAMALFGGAPGFFKPRLMQPWFVPAGGASATSYYETAKLRSTLEHLVDFDRINSGSVRFTVGAPSMCVRAIWSASTPRRTGSAPSTSWRAGRCRPAFPLLRSRASIIGMAASSPTRRSNGSSKTCHGRTPLPSRSISGAHAAISLAIWPKSRRGGRRSSTRAEPAPARAASIACKGCHAAAKLSVDMPEHVRNIPEMEVLQPMIEHKAYNIIQLIYRAKTYEGQSKDYEFSRRSMEEHWHAGYHDAVRTLRHPEVLRRSKTPDGVFTFDLHTDGRE